MKKSPRPRLFVPLAAGALLLLAAAGCRSATRCKLRIPEEFRADAIRYVMDRRMVDLEGIPLEDRELALRAGTPAAGLAADRKDAVQRWALTYETCIHGATSW